MMLSAFLLISSLMAVEGAANTQLAVVEPLMTPIGSPPTPTQLRVDLHLSHKDNREKGIFITLDNVYPQSLTPLLLSWALPTTISTQTSSRVWITTANSPTTNTTVFDSSWVSSSLQHAYVPRSLLLPSRAYEWTVAVKDGTGTTSAWAPTQRFFTSGGNATWGASSPIWAPSCAGNPAPPSFARFHADVPLGSSPRAVLSALLYITGSPPIYNDPWNVTKLLGGYKLSINDTVWGVGPGRTSCGPLPPGINYGSQGGPSAAFPPPQCTPVQPVDGYDVSLAITQALAAGATTLPLDIASYGLVQNKYNIVPAVQATLHVRWSPEGSSPDLIFGTSTTPGDWVALDGDGLYNPSGNKAPFWYTQPREDTNNSCLPSTPTAKPCNQCGWVTPVPALGAWIGGTVPLAGKTTQALSFTHSPGQVDATVQLGPGWYLYDSGGEFQGGVRLQLLPTSTSVPNGALALIQLSSQLAANGSALWNTRAGNHYQDAWRFPDPATATPQQRAIEHHEYSEFRYAEVIWSDALSGEALPLVPGVDFELTFWAVHYPYDKEGATFISTSSPDLDAVFSLAATTLKTTTLDFYADSNSRQRSIDCMADETTAALNQYATTTELAMQRMTAGQFMGITPLGYVSGNWADWTILPGLNIFYDALFTGDLTFAAQYFDVLIANHTYAYLIDSSTKLLHNGGALSALIDTSGGSDDNYHQSDVNSVVNSWSYLALRSFASLGRWLGRMEEANTLDDTASDLALAFQTAMFNGTSAICDGICASTPHTAAHATFYALYSGILDGAAFKPALVDFLLAKIAGNGDLGMPCGSYPAQFLLGGLYNADTDHGNAAYTVLTSRAPHSWINMMEEYGATATMECWLPEELDNLSFSHIWSSSPSFTVPWLFFGVTPTSPGYASFQVKPQPGPVLKGSGRLSTIRGEVSVTFEQGGESPGTKESTLSLTITVPGGTTAKALLPLWGCTTGMTVTLDGKAVTWVAQGDYAAVDGIPAGEHFLASSLCPKA